MLVSDAAVGVALPVAAAARPLAVARAVLSAT
jgi:hypothetical protein